VSIPGSQPTSWLCRASADLSSSRCGRRSLPRPAFLLTRPLVGQRRCRPAPCLSLVSGIAAPPPASRWAPAAPPPASHWSAAAPPRPASGVSLVRGSSAGCDWLSRRARERPLGAGCWRRGTPRRQPLLSGQQRGGSRGTTGASAEDSSAAPEVCGRAVPEQERSPARPQARGNGRQLEHGQFRTCVRRNFFTVRMTELWNRLPREAVASPCLEIFQSRMDAHLCSLLQAARFAGGLDAMIPGGPFQAPSCDYLAREGWRGCLLMEDGERKSKSEACCA